MAVNLQAENNELRKQIQDLRICANNQSYTITRLLKTEQKFNKQAQLIGELRADLAVAQSRLEDYDKAPRARLGARGGWWSVQDRPRGKGSEAKAGWYLRIPNQPAYRRIK